MLVKCGSLYFFSTRHANIWKGSSDAHSTSSSEQVALHFFLLIFSSILSHNFNNLCMHREKTFFLLFLTLLGKKRLVTQFLNCAIRTNSERRMNEQNRMRFEKNFLYQHNLIVTFVCQFSFSCT